MPILALICFICSYFMQNELRAILIAIIGIGMIGLEILLMLK